MSTTYNTKLIVQIDSDTTVSELNKLFKLDVETKAEPMYNINSSDGWKVIEIGHIEDIRFLLFSTIVSDEEFKIKFLLYKETEDEVIGTGDGSTMSFSNTLANVPVIANNMVVKYTINDTEYEAEDDGSGNITGTYLNTGTITYATGAISLEFSLPPDDGIDITVDSCYADSNNYLVFKCSDTFLYGIATNFGKKIEELSISTDSTTDQEIKVQILGVASS